jgi:hypothetical protein
VIVEEGDEVSRPGTPASGRSASTRSPRPLAARTHSSLGNGTATGALPCPPELPYKRESANRIVHVLGRDVP